ncbi:MAG: TIGR03862 family flavoprotein [Terrimicrobiaceae bacterium]|nr:TIGR03862 family flavoprotein [Terrimicrobiaceae bacterium]
MDELHRSVVIIGGGPAGLHAAEICAAGGARVTVCDAKASVGRKFLVAGGGGLNLTKEEALERFAARYRGSEMPTDFWPGLVAEFGPDALRAWAAGLGIETFAASTGRVYPREMKAAPLLRAWVQRLRRMGVRFAMHHRWIGFRNGALEFETPDGLRAIRADAGILALGGGSWPETGSDGRWVAALERCGVEVAALRPANCGWEIAWPPEVLAEAEGLPVKNLVVRAGGEKAAGELLITRYGLEGGAIYQLGAALRAMERPAIEIDFKPALSVEQLVAKLGPARRNWLAEARSRWKLGPGAVAIFSHHPGSAAWDSAATLARTVKCCRIALAGPRPLAEAISSAGGVRWGELDCNLMLKRLPGVFVAGEMIDWEAPTGGYLMQGAFATGMRSAQGALAWMAGRL